MEKETVGGLSIKQLSDRWKILFYGRKIGHVFKDKIAVKNTGKR